jgi:hypothetical protein
VRHAALDTGATLTPAPATATGPAPIAVERPDTRLVRAAAAPKPKPKPKPIARATKRRVPRAHRPTVFSGLGAWVDQFDFGHLDPGRTVALLRANGVHTLYLQSGESSTVEAVHPQDGPWLATAHAAGIKVVAWYLPHYSDVKLDVNRMVAAARYRYAGNAFDGVGVDIEYRRAVHGPAWMRAVARHLQLLRGALGAHYPIAAIPPPPLQMAVAPGYWAGFPWAALGRYSSDIMLMDYWSARNDCATNRLHCAYEYTKFNILQTRTLARSNVPIHVIGGVATNITARELAAFVKAAKDARADGASIYDVGSTPAAWWSTLRPLRSLGR